MQAGHGAANVTIGIPRLRELLQLGAKTKTPQIIIPIKRGGDALGDRVKDRIALENAHAALRGFKTIRMEDFVHAVGVEANVYYQVGCRVWGCCSACAYKGLSSIPLT